MLVFSSFILLVKGGIFSVFYKLFISYCRAVYCFRAVLGTEVSHLLCDHLHHIPTINIPTRWYFCCS